jgi:hypothetical protein
MENPRQAWMPVEWLRLQVEGRAEQAPQRRGLAAAQGHKCSHRFVSTYLCVLPFDGAYQSRSGLFIAPGAMR